jgi:hypothetical protein
MGAKDFVEDIKKIVNDVLTRLGVRPAYMSKIDPSYTGGAPKTMDAGDSAAPAATDLVLAAYAHCNVTASDQMVKMPLQGGGFVLLGKPITPPPGKLTIGKFWLAILPYVDAVSATAITGRAQRLDCEKTITVNNVMFEITTGGVGLVARVKLFSSDGVLVIDTDDVSCASTGNKTAAISPAVTLIPGTYIVNVTASATVAWRCADLPANFAAVMNIGTTQRATDETMGAASTAVSFPIVKFQS